MPCILVLSIVTVTLNGQSYHSDTGVLGTGLSVLEFQPLSIQDASYHRLVEPSPAVGSGYHVELLSKTRSNALRLALNSTCLKDGGKGGCDLVSHQQFTDTGQLQQHLHQEAARMAPSASQQPIVPLLDVLELVLDGSDLGVLELQCLARCSKACSSAATAALANCAASLLLSAVKQAAATEQEGCLPTRKEVRAVRLLLQKACRKQTCAFLAVPTAAPHFLRISNVPKVVASQLLKAGLRFSLQQLWQAMQAHAEGVEVWVKAITDQTPAVKKALRREIPYWVHTLLFTPAALVSASKYCIECNELLLYAANTCGSH
jgi:hypothetical protein